jgi:hypothetical protein
MKSWDQRAQLSIECTNFNNPLYRQVLAGFSVRVDDNETPDHPIINAIPFSLDLSAEDALKAVEITAPYASGSVETPIQFALYAMTGNQAAIAVASIQTEIMF